MDLKYFFVLFVLSFGSTNAILPRTINRCRADQNFNACLKQVLLDIRPYLKLGDFGENFKIPSLDPLYQPEINVVGPDYNFKLSHVNVKGITGHDILNVKSDLQNLVFDLHYYNSQITYAGKYKGAQKFPFLDVDLRGEGDMSGILIGVHGRIRVKFMIVGDQVKLKKFQYKMKIDDGKFKISSLRLSTDQKGQSSAVLTEILNNFLNSDPSYLLRRIEPSMGSNFTAFFKQIVDVLFRDVRVSDFYAA